jgi:hypothetical protein
MKGALNSSETSVLTKAIRRNNPEDAILNLCLRTESIRLIYTEIFSNISEEVFVKLVLLKRNYASEIPVLKSKPKFKRLWEMLRGCLVWVIAHLTW